jgi:UDP-glucose 4-epimerase
MRLLVTGSTGFVGSHLLPRLVEKHEVTCLVSSTAIGTRPLPRDAQICYGDLTDAPLVEGLVRQSRPEAIIHLAAVTPVRYSFQFPAIYQSVNFAGTVGLVQGALRLGSFDRFVFASTMEIYGWQAPRTPFREDRRPHPASPYAVSKLASEQYLQMIGRAAGFPHVVLRPCNTFGRRHESGYVVEYVVTRMLEGCPVHLGTPEAVRDFMYVDDHVNAYLKALDLPLGAGEPVKRRLEEDPHAYVFNVGWGSEVRVADLAERVRKATGFTGEVQAGFPPDYPLRPVIEPYLSVDAAKARAQLGWTPAVTLDEGIRRTIETWRAAERFGS